MTRIFNELIINIIENPFRYIGAFRANNAKTKLIQNITQSRNKIWEFFRGYSNWIYFNYGLYKS